LQSLAGGHRRGLSRVATRAEITVPPTIKRSSGARCPRRTWLLSPTGSSRKFPVIKLHATPPLSPSRHEGQWWHARLPLFHRHDKGLFRHRKRPW
jgi:hypothetical protein